MMLITGGAVAGAGALIAAPFREEIAATARAGADEHADRARGLLSLANAGYEEWAAQVGSIFALGDGTRLHLGRRPGLPVARNAARAASAATARSSPCSIRPGGQSVAPDLIHTASHSAIWAAAALPVGGERRAHARRMLAVFNWIGDGLCFARDRVCYRQAWTVAS